MLNRTLRCFLSGALVGGISLSLTTQAGATSLSEAGTGDAAWAYAMPNADTLAAMEPGESIQLLPLGPTFDTSSKLRVDARSLPKEFINSDGTVEVGLEFQDGRQGSVMLDAGEVSDVRSSANALTVNGKESALLPGQDRSTTDSASPLCSVPPTVQVAAGSAGATKAYNARVADIYNWSGAPATVTFSSKSSAKLGVGVSVNGGGMKASGTRSMKNSNTSSQTRGEIVRKRIYNRVNYRNYTIIGCTTTRTERRPHSSNRFFNSMYDVSHSYKYTRGCHKVPGGKYTSITKDDDNNRSYSTGVDIGPINVHSEQDWESGTKVKYSVKKDSRYCGSSSNGTASSSGVSFKKW